MKKFLFTIIFFLGLGSAIFATLPTDVAHAAFNNQINYQGRLTTPAGIAVPNGNYNMQFNLYTVPTGGTSIWTETDCYSTNNGSSCTGSGTDQRVTVTNGLFSIMLGSTSPLTNVNFNQTLYLGVNIGGSGTTPSYDGEMTPRKILGAVPAAMYSATSTVALTLNGQTSGEFFRDDALNSTSSASTSLSITQLGSGKIAEFFGQSSTSVLSLLSNGDVGIGSSTPGSLLTVIGNSYLGGNVTITGTTTLAASLNGLLFGTNGVVSAISTSSLGIPNYFANSSATTTLTTGSILAAGEGYFGKIFATSSATLATTTANQLSVGPLGAPNTYLYNDGDVSFDGGSFTNTVTGFNATAGNVGNTLTVNTSDNGEANQFLVYDDNANPALAVNSGNDAVTTFHNTLDSGNGGVIIAGHATLATASTTGLTVTATSTLSGIKLSNLSSTILAVDANGNVIATATPSYTNYFSNSSATTSLTTGSVLAAAVIDATSTTTPSAFADGVTVGTSGNTWTPSGTLTTFTVDANCSSLNGNGDNVTSCNGFVNSTNGNGLLFPSGLNNNLSTNGTSGYDELTTASGTLMLTSAGNLGVGTTTPGSLLTVAGNSYLGGNITVSGTTVISGTTTQATSTISSLTVTSTSTLTGLKLTNLANTILAVDANGNVIATTTAGGGTNYFANSASTTSLSTGSVLTAGVGTFGTINATSTTGTSTLGGALQVNGSETIGSTGIFAANQSLALGYASTATYPIAATGTGAIAAGYDTPAGGGIFASGNGSLAMGSALGAGGATISASGAGSLALGEGQSGNIIASGSGSVALGYATSGNISATGLAAFALGENVNATANNAFALGSGFTNPTASTFEVGFASLPALTVGTTNVGIGTTTPGTLLTVAGNAQVTATTTTRNLVVSGVTQISGPLVDENGSAGAGGDCLIQAGPGVEWSTTCGTNYFTNSSATTSLSTGSILAAGTGTFGAINATSTTGTSTFSGNVVFGSSTAPVALAVSSAGYVGIGTSTPNNILSVVGPTGVNDPLATFSSPGATDADSIYVANATDRAEVWVAGTSNEFVTGSNAGDVGIMAGTSTANTFLGSGGLYVTNLTGGSWINLPTTGPSGIGVGGAGVNPFLAYASTAGSWFTNSAAGDTAYRNITGKLDFGGTSGNYQFVISSTTEDFVNGNVGIGTSTPGSLLTVAGALQVTSTSTLTGLKLTNLANTVLAVDSNGNVIATTTAGGGSTPVTWTLGNGFMYSGSSPASTTENVGIGSTSPIAELSVEGSSSQPTEDMFDVASSSNVINFDVKASGNVGIGTSTPGSTLTVAGTGYFTGNVGIGTTSASAALAVGVSGSGAILSLGTTAGNVFNFARNVTTGDLQIQGSQAGFNNIDLASSSGNVAIGTTSPFDRLTVDTGGTTTSGGISITAGGAYGANIDLAGGSNAYFTGATAGDLNIRNYPGHKINLGINNAAGTSTPLLTLSGNYVGVGTTTPGNVLDVFNSTTTATLTNIAHFAGAGTYVGLAIDAVKASNGGQPNLLLQKDGSTTFELGSDFNDNNTRDFYVYDVSNSAARLYISSAGNVGIGTTTPVSKFEVSGSACIIQGTGTTTCGTAAGNIYYKAANTGNYDVAENYQTKDLSIAPGDIVAADPTTSGDIMMANGSSTILGVISTDPGLLLGGADGSVSSTSARAVALAGRVPVNVDLENGPIAVGDEISLSGTPGVGMKSNGTGTVIGVALEPYTSSGIGQIEVFVNLQQYGLSFNSGSGASASSTAATLASSTSFVQTIADAVVNSIESAGNWVIGKLSATTVISNDIQTQTIEAQTVTAQTAAVTNGLQMTDEATGYIYCVRIINGNFAKALGTCSNATSTDDSSYMGTSGAVSSGQSGSQGGTDANTGTETNTGGNTDTNANMSSISPDQASSTTATTTVSTTIATSTSSIASTTASTSAATSTTAETAATSTPDTTSAPIIASTTPDVSTDVSSSTPSEAVDSSDQASSTGQ